MSSDLTRPDLLALRQGASIVKLKNLPLESQLALIQYMAIDGEAWDIPELFVDKLWETTYTSERRMKLIHERLLYYLPWFISKYGEFEIGYQHGIPASQLIESIMQDEGMYEIMHDDGSIQGWSDFDSYHDWYMSYAMSKYPVRHDVRKPLWPVILSNMDHETLQDGWHRLHWYINQGIEYIPALFYI